MDQQEPHDIQEKEVSSPAPGIQNSHKITQDGHWPASCKSGEKKVVVLIDNKYDDED